MKVFEHYLTELGFKDSSDYFITKAEQKLQGESRLLLTQFLLDLDEEMDEDVSYNPVNYRSNALSALRTSSYLEIYQLFSLANIKKVNWILS